MIIEIDKNNRYHLYEDVYARVENRSKEINNKLGASFMHRSEKGWNKPQKKGERHILNLPLGKLLCLLIEIKHY